MPRSRLRKERKEALEDLSTCVERHSSALNAAGVHIPGSETLERMKNRHRVNNSSVAALVECVKWILENSKEKLYDLRFLGGRDARVIWSWFESDRTSGKTRQKYESLKQRGKAIEAEILGKNLSVYFCGCKPISNNDDNYHEVLDLTNQLIRHHLEVARSKKSLSQSEYLDLLDTALILYPGCELYRERIVEMPNADILRQSIERFLSLSQTTT